MRSLRRAFRRFNPKVPLFALLLTFSFCVLSFSIYNLRYTGLIFPDISVAGTSVSGMDTTKVLTILSKSFTLPQKIKLVNQNQSFDLNTKDLGFSYDFTGTSQSAFNLGRTGDIFYDLVKRADLLIHPVNIGLEVVSDEDKLAKFISVVAGQDSIEPKNPSIAIVKGAVVVNRGSPGSEVDQNQLKLLILSNLKYAKGDDIIIPIRVIDNSLTESEAKDAKIRAEKYLGKNIQLKFEYTTFTLADSDIIKLLDLRGGFDGLDISKEVSEVATKVERDPQNPKFTFDSGRVTEFQPATDGIKVDQTKFEEQLIDSLNNLEQNSDKSISFDIPVERTPPEVSTDKVNNLGIKELIGRGTSTYYHSIPSRVYNVVLAASRLNGTLVKPGQTFSFNDTLGDVSAFTGYQQAYIISEGKTILGDGGGVCQVSTTLFRAVLNAGLPVVERAAHAYRVGYYEQNSPPGLDATVYGPSPDLKFINDTPGYILIEAIADAKHYSLIFELYGTSDGRIATTSKPIVSDITPPPDDLYQDDPTLPLGTIKQVDFKAWGAKVIFNYVVSRGGEQIYKKTFISDYRPWQAIFLRGTGPAI